MSQSLTHRRYSINICYRTNFKADYKKNSENIFSKSSLMTNACLVSKWLFLKYNWLHTCYNTDLDVCFPGFGPICLNETLGLTKNGDYWVTIGLYWTWRCVPLDTVLILARGVCPPLTQGWMQNRFKVVQMSLCSNLANPGGLQRPLALSIHHPFAVLEGLQAMTLPQGKRNQIQGIVTGAPPSALMPSKPNYLWASNVSCSQGGSLLLWLSHSKAWPEVSFSLAQSNRTGVINGICSEQTSPRPSRALMLVLPKSPKNGNNNDSPLHVYQYNHGSFETLIITHSWKRGGRPRYYKVGCYCLFG